MHATQLAGRRARPPRRRNRFVLGVTAFAMLLGICMLRDGMSAHAGPPQPPAAAAAGSVQQPVAPTGAQPAPPPAPAPLPPSTPTRIKIPVIRVDAPLTKTGRDKDGWLEAPPQSQKNLAGWYQDAVTPGAPGTSVIVGHVDNNKGPVVFYNLGALKKGNRIEVVREDQRTALFTIYGIEVFPKNRFPSDRVYNDTPQPELRIITCGGGYTKKTGYLGNVVVFARLTGAR